MKLEYTIAEAREYAIAFMQKPEHKLFAIVTEQVRVGATVFEVGTKLHIKSFSFGEPEYGNQNPPKFLVFDMNYQAMSWVPTDKVRVLECDVARMLGLI
jgi:hypothetical protein